VPAVQAEEDRFTNRSLQGGWGFSADAEIDGVGAAVAAGLYTFDGEGGCTFSETLNISAVGVSSRSAEICTYSVNADGTGTIARTFADASISNVAFVIVDRKKELRFIVTDLGLVASGVAKRQSQR
jgi:hypothetical protein